MPCPALEVADISRDHGAAWRQADSGHVSLGRLKAMSAIRLPDRSPRRPCRVLTALYDDRLQLLPQSALPKMPRCSGQAMAGRTPARLLAAPSLSHRVHDAGGDCRHRLPEQGRRL